MKRVMAVLLTAGLVAVSASAEKAWGQAAAADPFDKLAAGKAAFEKVCSVCHGLDRPNAKVLDAEGWGKVVDRMKANGAAVDAEKREQIVGWLAAKSAFDAKCSACHGTDRPLGKSKSRADWTATVQRMSAKKPGHLSDAEAAAIASYLSIVRPGQ